MTRRSALFFVHLIDYSLLPFLLVLAFHSIESTLAHPTETYLNDGGETLTFSYIDQPEFHRAIFGLYVMGPLTLAATILYTVALLRARRFPITLYAVKAFLFIFTAICVRATFPAEPFLLLTSFAIAACTLFGVILFNAHRRQSL